MPSISITRALALQKSLTERIIKAATVEIIVVAPTRGEGSMLAVVDSSKSVDEHTAIINSSYQSLQDLIIRRDAIRKQILISNATTNVTIAGKEYSVVEAIDARKNISEKEALLNRLKQNKNWINTVFQKAQLQYDEAIEQTKNSAIGTGKKYTEEELQSFISPLKATSKPGILDPLDIAKVISDLENEIIEFKTNVDYVLSESNATTFIDVPE